MNIPPKWATHLVRHPAAINQWWWSERKHQKVERFSPEHLTRFSQREWENEGWVFEEINIQLEND